MIDFWKKMNDNNQTFLLSHLLILAKKKRVIIITDFISHFCESKNKKMTDIYVSHDFNKSSYSEIITYKFQ